MNDFVIKYLDGREEKFSGKTEKKNDNVTEVTLCEKIEYEKVDYVEIELNQREIKAGDEGFYLVQAGNKRCENRDIGIGYFSERPDGEYILRDIFMPVFGISHNKNAFVAIVTGMEMDVCQYIKIEDGKYSVRARFEFSGIVPYENIKIEFHCLPKDADYNHMAKVYREYVLKNGFVPIKERLNPELKYSVEVPNIRIRMGWKPVPCEIYEQTPENEPPVHVACTFDDVIKIMESYKKHGIDKAEFCLVGWNMKGHDGRWPQILPVEESLGGEEKLRKVIKRANELGYAMTCHTNSTDLYSVSEIFNEDDVALLPNGEKSVEAVRWGGGRTYNSCPKRAFEVGMETLPDVAKLGFQGMHYIDVITATEGRACFNPKHLINKKEAGEYFDRLFSECKKMFGSTGSEGPYVFYLKECDFCLYVSFADFADKLYPVCDRTIPFWQLVFHGIVASNPYAKTVNSTASQNPDDKLKVVEYGGKPQFYYYAQFVADGTDWIGKGDLHCSTDEEIENATLAVKKAYDEYKELAYLQYEFMEEHKEVADNVFEITYSDGSVVTVDYNKKTYEVKRG